MGRRPEGGDLSKNRSGGVCHMDLGAFERAGEAKFDRRQVCRSTSPSRSRVSAPALGFHL